MTAATNGEVLFGAYLNQFDDAAWEDAISSLLPEIHEVDRTATRIWFKFYPIELLRALQESDEPAKLAAELQLCERYYLKDQIDSSHSFLYGHRYWPQVKEVVSDWAESEKAPASLELAMLIRTLACEVGSRLGEDESLLLGITAVALMTLEHTGARAFKTAPGKITIEGKPAVRTPAQALRERARNDSQGPFGFLRGDRKIYSVTFDENDGAAKFELIASQHLTTAAAEDKRNSASRDPRCIDGEGPIPVQCRSASCGSCWIGVLGGAEKLSEVKALEGRRLKEFGYINTEEPKPIIRLACQAQAYGAVSIVIPPWNGIFGRYLTQQREESSQTQNAQRT